jgi:hypothetical protein
VGRGALLIGPGGRWRLECSVPGRGAEGEAAEGNDGEHGWSSRPPERGGPPPLPVEVNGAYPPVPGLLCPSCLLGRAAFQVAGPVSSRRERNITPIGSAAVASMNQRVVALR